MTNIPPLQKGESQAATGSNQRKKRIENAPMQVCAWSVGADLGLLWLHGLALKG